MIFFRILAIISLLLCFSGIWKIKISLFFFGAFVFEFLYQFINYIRGLLFPKEIDRNKIPIYTKHRNEFQTGDVIAFQGTDFFAKLIRRGTKSQYSHVGMVIKLPMADNKFRIFIIEAVTQSGVVLMPFSRRLLSCSGKVWWLPLKDEVATHHRNAIFQKVMERLGDGYDFGDIVNIVVRILHIAKKLINGNGSSFICSELVASTFKDVGILKDIKPLFMTPQDVVRQKIYKETVQILG